MALPAKPERYQPKHKVRFITAASLFDGHDAAINIMRRILQAHGAEVVHLGHNRSVADIVDAAIQEDAQAIAVSSYQGGHIEFFKYMIDLLRQRGAGHVLVFGGGGGVIVPREIAELEAYGVAKIFSPEDGRSMGLDGMIEHMIKAADFDPASLAPAGPLGASSERWLAVARAITRAEEGLEVEVPEAGHSAPVLGITGTGGAGKSSVTDELVLRFLADFPALTIAILSVDPTKRKTGGALLGDRIRLNSLGSDRVFMRSLATRQAHRALSAHIERSIGLCRAAGFGLVLVESSGIGQADSEIVDVSDVSLYVMTPEYGAAMQLEKIDMLDFADFVAINKFDRPQALDALRDVRKQYRRSHGLFEGPGDDELPVYATIASQFHDRGINNLYQGIVRRLAADCGAPWTLEGSSAVPTGLPERHPTIPGDRTGYLRAIAGAVRGYCRGEPVDAGALAVVDPAELLQDLLAVGDAALTFSIGSVASRSADVRHQLRRLAAFGSSGRSTSWWYTVPGVGTTCEGRHAGDADAVAVHLRGEALGEALERRLLGAVERAAAQRRALVRAAPGTDRRAAGDVHDRARRFARSCPASTSWLR